MEIQGLENQSGDICPKSLLGFFFSFILLTREKLQCQMFKSTWGCVLFFFWWVVMLLLCFGEEFSDEGV